MSPSLRAAAAGLALIVSASAAAAGDYQAQAERLATLRAEVESLSSELTADKEEARARQRAIEAQKVELEVQLRRQELRLERLVAEEESQRVAIAGGGEASPAVRAVVLTGIEALEAEVKAGLPFQTEARLRALDELRGKLAADTVAPEQAAARLWAFAEDERRLSRENALSRQVIEWRGEEVLVDVARIGMVALYWQAPDGAVGVARRDGGAWQWAELTGREAESVSELFTALEKGIHSGWFSLPALTAEVTR
jgi:hypothetical protein